MRSLLFLLALALLASACKMNVQMSDPPFTLDSLMTYDYKGLEKMVGADNLKDSLAHDAKSSASVRYTWLLPGTRSAVRLQWTDTTRSTIAFASIFGYAPGASAWKTRDSVTVGIPITQLEKINSTPFYFYNNVPEVNNPDNDMQVATNPGYVMMWTTDGKSESKLSGHVYAVRLNANIAPGKEHRADFFSSNSPEALASNPIVTEVTLDMHAVGFVIVVEKITFTTSAGATSTLPHIVTRSGRKDPRADSMNQVILKYFDIGSFDPKAVTDFPWDVTFDAEMDESTLALRIKGTYMGSYPSDIDEMLFIGKDGYKREAMSIPFHSLFAYDGYFNFLNKYWSASCKTKMEEAEECAGTLPSCNCYDIVATVVNKKVVLSLKGDCYPHAAAACNPTQEVTLSLEELKPYLSNFGKNIVVEQGYYEQSALKQFNIANNAMYSMPQVFFVRFDIIYDNGVSGPDQAMMGFELLPAEYDPYNGEITGWIRFDNIEQEPILLKGKFEEGGILELWDPQDGIAMKFPLRWVMDEGHFDKGHFEGGTAHETYSFIAMLYTNVEAFEERGD